MNEPSISYEIKTTEIRPYSYKTPIVSSNKNEELSVSFLKHHPVHIKKLVLLNMVGRDQSGKIVSYQPIDVVNRFLMSHHINDGREESTQYSKALVHFLSFLISLQEMWDREFDEDVFDEQFDLPRPEWDYMATRKSDRITYQYRTALIHAATKETDPEKQLSRRTASAYMNGIVKFYSYHILDGHEFNNPPFEHEVVNINYQTDGNYMGSTFSKAVHTSDLRLNFPKSKRNDGGDLPSARRDLKPLRNKEWELIKNILLEDRRVIKNIKGNISSAPLAIEYCLFFLVSRYTGLRKEEVASLHLGQVKNPSGDKAILRLGVGELYGSLTKTPGGGNKSRTTIIPTSIMTMLHDYTKSSRYLHRQEKFKALCKEMRDCGNDGWFDSEDGVDETKHYLFISATGKPFFTKLDDLNARWGEIRKTVSSKIGYDFDAVIHNLRSTFAVSLFRILLRKTTVDIALSMVSECLGHEDQATTLLYLKMAQDLPTGDEIYEDILDYIGVFDELKEVIPVEVACDE